MEIKEGIALNSKYVNKMKTNGELGWFLKEENASTGYRWNCYPDNSGVYELVEEGTLHPSTEAAGVPGMKFWKFKAVGKGKGAVKFELLPPATKEAAEEVIVNIEVNQ